MQDANTVATFSLRGDDKTKFRSHVCVLGAGPAGALLSILLAKRGFRVTAFERLPDLRHTQGVSGRSINLALADRGIHALKCAGVFSHIEPLMMPMRGRMLHDESGNQSLIPYGAQSHEVIYSISRSKLTAALLDCAEALPGVDIRFRQTCISVDPAQQALCMQDLQSGRLFLQPLGRVFGADGAGSVLRRYLVEHADAHSDEQLLSHGYKELDIAADAGGKHRLDPGALHVWPRGDFMLIALPNIDGSFTATLFLPHDGPTSFATLREGGRLREFFAKSFPDALAILPDLETQFAAHPTGSMGTVRLDKWTLGNQLTLVGDAAHAVVPFHGQGMNCAFEDCVELDTLLAASGTAEPNWQQLFATYQSNRKPNSEAIADMALENYVEMRDTVRHPKFQLQKSLSLELERRHPRRFVPRYSMVMFHHEIPYAEAYRRGAVQAKILNELTESCTTLDDVDFVRAERLINTSLSELPK